MTKRLFFIHSRNKSLLKRFGKEDSIIYLDNFAAEKNIEDYVKRVENKKREMRLYYNIKWLQNWAFKKINNNKSFAEELVFEGKSFWYPLEYFIHFDVDFLDSDISLSRILLHIDCVKNIIKETKPFQVIIENEKTCFNKIVKRICEKEKINILNLKLKYEREQLSKQIINNPLIVKTYIKSRILLRIIIAKLFCKKIKSADVLVLTSDRLSNKENTTDYYWGSLCEEMNKHRIKYKLAEYDRIDVLNSMGNIRKRYFPQKYDAQFIGTYYNKETIRKIHEIVRFLKNKFFELDKEITFRKSLTYEGIYFYDLIRPRLKKIFLSYSYYISDVYAISQSMIKKEKPKLILVDHEKNYYGRALITEANSKNIRSVAFEGELLYENNTYQTQLPIKELLDTKNPVWRPIPSIKFLWGNYAKKWHTHKNFFPEKKLKIIGAPKYDFLKSLNETNNQKIRKKYELNNEKLITIITTDCPWEEDLLKTTFKYFQNKNNVKLIIKMHPNDSELKRKKIESWLQQYKLRGIVIKDENLSKLIYSADMIITYTSTAVYECILMNKKVVVADFAMDSGQPYVTDNLIKLCRNSNELSAQINKEFNSKGMLNERKRREFIKKYLFSDDGKASERAVKYIKEVMSLINP
ncbi:MAG: CDP-glycerol glycerophosphotransferase family protein [Nanoarchaeota archaeon]|nr:CDP-glycerol glycerophosphotransferase family protein [Nanoarchaeota archaeon]MBU1597082.1 CDP-glycerol glycerophosphotransferase family protein [Nanoarchaeota archaeon]